MPAVFKVHRVDPRATLPAKASPGAAGYDLTSTEMCIIPAHGRAVIPTGLAFSLPPHTYARLAPRSGLAAKHSIGVGAGVVDADYTGAVGVVLFNHGDCEFRVNPGDRIAQVILETIVDDAVVEEVSGLDGTLRGVNGFGSTGS